MRPPRNELSGVFDLQLLKPAADTLRTFEYATQGADESRLDPIPTILPHLTKLTINWGKDFANHSLLWKACTIFYFPLNGTNVFLQPEDAVIQNDKLTDLELSSYFEVNAHDSIEDALVFYAFFADCYERSIKATQDIASAYPRRLQRCRWVHHIPNIGGCYKICHSFIVEDRLTGGNVTRVVREESSNIKWSKL